MFLAPPVTFIGPWTFIYGLAFGLIALGLGRVKRWFGIGFLLATCLYLKDIPGTFFAASLFILDQVAPLRWKRAKSP